MRCGFSNSCKRLFPPTSPTFSVSSHAVPTPPSRYSTVSSLPPLSLLPPSPSARHVRQAHAQLVVLGHAASRAATAHLLASCALCPSAPPHYYHSIYRRIDRPNVFANNNFIRCLARGDAPKDSLLFYSHMRRNSMPANNYTYPFLLQACCRNSPSIKEGAQLHAHAVRLGLDGDLFVRNALIHFYSECGEINESKRVFDELPEQRDVVTWNAILAGYARAERIDVAEELFDVMPKRDAISWSTLIMGYVQCEMFEKGLDLFKDMLRRGLMVNEAMLVTVLSASAQLGLLEHGRFVHDTIKDWNFPMSTAIGTALVDMYAKCGCIKLARQVFDEMPRNDVFAWNVMICGLATHGMAKEALELFQRFVRGGLRPNNITFVGILNACSRTGLVTEGRHYFKSMVGDYGVKPEMEHYGCMVDLLGRAGLVSEALELIEGMSVAPDPVLWATLLGACKMHGLVDLGVTIGKRLIELEPSHDGHYVLLASLYAKERKWEEVNKIRRLMTTRGTNKVAGWSLIEAHGSVHKFVAGDREPKRSTEIHKVI